MEKRHGGDQCLVSRLVNFLLLNSFQKLARLSFHTNILLSMSHVIHVSIHFSPGFNQSSQVLQFSETGLTKEKRPFSHGAQKRTTYLSSFQTLWDLLPLPKFITTESDRLWLL